MTVSAEENPLRMQRLEALRFQPQGTTWSALLARLKELRYRAAIIGPHGSGKTTLLEQLQAPLRDAGLTPRLLFRNADGPGRLPDAWREAVTHAAGDDVLLVDGYGHCHMLARAWLRRQTARRGAGLVVTGHRPAALPTLLHTGTSPALLADLLTELGVDVPAERVEALFAAHHGNLREAMRQLYDEIG